jgi:protease Do-like 9
VIDSGTGVLVTRALPLGCCSGVLERGDVLLAIDGNAIADDGTVAFRKSERISFSQLLHAKFAGDTVNLRIWREKRPLDVPVALSGGTPALVKFPLCDERPRFFIHAGLVFLPLSLPFMRSAWGKSWDAKAPIRLCEKAFNGVKSYNDEEVVVLAHVLAADVNVGYRGQFNLTVLRVNGTSVRNLAHLVDVVEGCGKNGFLFFDLDFERQIILRADVAVASNAEILAQHSIAKRCSDDLAHLLSESRTAK